MAKSSLPPYFEVQLGEPAIAVGSREASWVAGLGMVVAAGLSLLQDSTENSAAAVAALNPRPTI
ncbi:MAG: hypothetical protein V1724_07830 [Chloroflexota bacterium]